MRIDPLLHKATLNSFDEKMNDLSYWLTQPVIKRLEAVVSTPYFKQFYLEHDHF